MIDFIDYIGNRLLRQFCNSSYCSKLHVFIDGLCMNVECATEDIGEADDIIDLVGIIASSGAHQYVRAAGNGIVIGDFRYRIG